MEYSIQAGIAPKKIYPSTLKLGGTSPAGDRFGFSNYYMELNGEPFFGICGEFHYSRYPASGWLTELRKMKMAGINIVATYIFWNHHEETEGDFDWQGDRNLRAFIDLCAECGLYVILRIGPFCHGEVRNGGIPDWMFGRSFDLRSNDEGYLVYVRRLYGEIGRQAQGTMFGEGGPVIGIQLENEWNAAAALWELTAKQGDEYMSGGSGDGETHMRLLKEMAVEAGLKAPIYTSTGWGGAPVLEDEVLPLYGGYAYTPWSISEKNPNQQPTGEYVFADYHNEAAEIPEFRPPYDRTRYPFACCEMGGGMQTWYLSRFQVEPESVQAMSLMKIAGGCNFVGYYMFHGGTNPIGSTGQYLNESTTPRITYDFQAPLGEFGQVRESSHLLRSLHFFLQAFGTRLAPLATVLPEGAGAIRPEHSEPLRYAARTDGKSGFLFVNNYQDHVEMKEHREVRFRIGLNGETLVFPVRGELTVRPNASFLLPWQLELSGVQLRYATAQPVTVHRSGEIETYFFRAVDPAAAEFSIAGASVERVDCESGTVHQEADGSFCAVVPGTQSSILRIWRAGGGEVRIYVMAEEDANQLWVTGTVGDSRVLFSGVPLAETGDGLEFSSIGQSEFTFREYDPAGSGSPFQAAGNVVLTRSREGEHTLWTVRVPARTVPLQVKPIHKHKVALTLAEEAWDGVSDVLLSINYTGNVGYAFAGGKLFHDHFYNGAPWEIGLSRFRCRLKDGELILETTPLRTGSVTLAADAAMAVERRFDGEAIAEFHSIKAEPVYSIKLTN